MKIKLTIILGILILSLISFASINALTIDNVKIYPEEIAPGKTAKISIDLDNEGNYDLTDLSVSLDFKDIPFAPIDSGSEYGIDEIKEGDSETAEFVIIALNNAESGIYKIPVKITYKENADIKTKESLISVEVFSEPELTMQVAEGLFLKNKENAISIKVVNKGLSGVKFLEIEIGTSVYYSLTSPNKAYIGDIDSNDFDNADFKILVKENSPNTLNIPVIITYKDAKNKEIINNDNLQIRVYSIKEATQLGLIKKDNTLIYIIIIAIVVISYLIYRRIKKRRRLKKATQGI